MRVWLPTVSKPIRPTANNVSVDGSGTAATDQLRQHEISVAGKESRAVAARKRRILHCLEADAGEA